MKTEFPEGEITKEKLIDFIQKTELKNLQMEVIHTTNGICSTTTEVQITFNIKKQ